MSTIVTRSGKGSPLTHNEVDANFTNLNTDKVEKTAADITGGTINGTTIGATSATTGKFSTLEATGNSTLGTGSSQYIQIEGGATAVLLSAQGAGTNIPLALQPKGTGALQAQATTSTAVGGNARGSYATDWQTLRGSAGQVASGLGSAIIGGTSNAATANGCMVGGRSNTASASDSVVSGGNANTASGAFSAIGGGNLNTAAGYFNFIGSGFTNAGTALAAVTTQATTAVTSGSTAVTLSATNASIKVGQYITGTGIASDTYVSAISTTSLTLSKNATATGTPTLSFFTPHGVVVGGGNNQATGSYSFIGGGGDAGTAANRNVASGDWSFVGGGRRNTASGAGSVIAGGGWDGSNVFANTASGQMSFIGSGYNNSASGYGTFIGSGASNGATGVYGTVGGGNSNTSSGYGSTVVGGQFGTTRTISGNMVFPASNAPLGSTQGISQSALLILAVQTTDATATALRSDTAAAGTTNQVILPNNSAYFFRGEVISGKTAAGDTKGWTIEGVIKRGANAASTALVGIPTVTSTYADAGASTWDIAVTADTTNGGIRVTFTGQAATTIRTVCRINTVEMTF
jgi:hypothetical protein